MPKCVCYSKQCPFACKGQDLAFRLYCCWARDKISCPISTITLCYPNALLIHSDDSYYCGAATQSVSQSVSQQSLYISLIWDYALCVCDWILPMIGWILVLHATECRLSIGRGSQRIRSFHKSKQVKGNDYPCMECQIAFLKLVSDFIISATPAAAYISYNGRCTNDVKI